MCYKPIHISNPVKHYNPLLDSSHLDVPCGHCPDCVAKRKSEWFVRLYFEYLETKKLGGYTLYFTLSYRPDALPIFCGTDHTPSKTFKDKFDINYLTSRKRDGLFISSDIPEIGVFQRKDLTTWLKSVKNRLVTLGKKQHFTDYKRWSRDFTYFAVPEFGGKLSRPHYHVLVNIKSPDLPFTTAVNIFKSSWEGYQRVMSSCKCTKGAVVDDVKGFGFCMHGKLGWTVKNYYAINYLLKYLEKDMCSDNVVFTKLLDAFPCEKNSETYKALRLATRPFVSCSPSIGKFIGARSDDGNFINITQNFRVKIPEVLQDGSTIYKEYDLPKSIVKLIFHDRITENVPSSDPERIRPYVRQTRYAIKEDGIRYRAYKLGEQADNTHFVYDVFRKFISSSNGFAWFKKYDSCWSYDFLVSQVNLYKDSQLEFLCNITAYDLADVDCFTSYLDKLRLRSWRIVDEDCFNACKSDIKICLSHTLLDTNMCNVYKVMFDWIAEQEDFNFNRDINLKRLQSLHRFLNSSSII